MQKLQEQKSVREPRGIGRQFVVEVGRVLVCQPLWIEHRLSVILRGHIEMRGVGRRRIEMNGF